VTLNRASTIYCHQIVTVVVVDHHVFDVIAVMPVVKRCSQQLPLKRRSI